MADLVRFVDSIVASPTVRLDLNGEATNGWYVRSFSAPAPRLRRSMSSNAMRDGINVGSSSYDARTLTLELECIKNDQDSAATELQKLARELDRESNFIMYQPDGATKPVFFKTFRSDLAQIDDVIAQKAMRRFTIELLAEPFALGLLETPGPFSLDSKEADGFTVSAASALGDVPTPLVLAYSASGSAFSRGYCGVRADRVTGMTTVAQAESLVLGTDTTNPGGGPDAAMSGTGTNNFVRTSFGTPSMTKRLEWNLATDPDTVKAMQGVFQVFAVVRRSGATSGMEIKVVRDGVSGRTVTLPLATGRIIVNLGLVGFEGDVERFGGYGAGRGSDDLSANLEFHARRVSGSETLDWDCIRLVPADATFMQWMGASGGGFGPEVIDAYNEAVCNSNTTDPSLFTSANPLAYGLNKSVSGGFPCLTPGVDNRIFMGLAIGDAATFDIARNDTVSAYYYPRYLYVRPSAS